MRVAPGRTAFIDGVQMYDALSDADKQWVQHSKVEYAPYPYEWIIDVSRLAFLKGGVGADEPRRSASR